MQALQKLLDNKVVVFWNAAYDIPVLEQHGFSVSTYIDALLLWRAASIDEDSYSLKALSQKHLNDFYQEEQELKDWLKKNKTKDYSKVPHNILMPYALKDAKNTLMLFLLIRDRCSEFLPTIELEHDIQRLVIEMEEHGFIIDAKAVNRLWKAATKQEKKLEAEIYQLAGKEFLISSPKQLGAILYADYPATRQTEGGAPSTDSVALKQLADSAECPKRLRKLAKKVLKYRSLKKLKKTYLKNFAAKSVGKGRYRILRTSFNQAGTKTGRFSSSNPNLQNIPRPGDSLLALARGCVVAGHGQIMLFIDYDQVELRLAAHYCNDPLMIQTILSGGDLHGETCKRLFGIDEDDPDWKRKRQIAKTLNFAIFYGIGPYKLRDTLLKMVGIYYTLSECKTIIDDYKDIYPSIPLLFRDVQDQVKKHGYVENFYGRRMYVNPKKSYVGVNYIIQSTAADLIKQRMLRCYKLLEGTSSYLIGTIHDELIFRGPEDELPKLATALQAAMEDRQSF
ncbi:MAG: hypothetical protein D6746_06460, partial [Bacteroidetes bacterium]